MAALGKIVAIASEQTRVAKIPEEDQKVIDAASQTMSKDEFLEWRIKWNKEKFESIRSSIPKFTMVHKTFWLHFLDDVKLPYFVSLTHESWEGDGFFSYTKTDNPIDNPNSLVENFYAEGFDMVTAREVYFLEESIFYVTAPPKIWATLEDLEYDKKNFKTSRTSGILERRIGRKNESLNVEDNSIAKRKGGRRGAKHGEAIAGMMLKLLQLQSSELNSYTALSLSLELKEEYRTIGETPPSSQNLERYSAGILKVLRA